MLHFIHILCHYSAWVLIRQHDLVCVSVGMRSISLRLFLLVIIQGINLVYSPQEPVDVALDLPAESLETQSVGPNKQLGLIYSCRMNTAGAVAYGQV